MKINPNVLRKKVIDMVVAKQSGHIGGAFSMAELTSVLYEDYDIGGKDKLILSKGHAVPIIYAVLHELGKISDDDLDLFREIDSPLQGHPDKLRLPLMDATTGSLGQGLSIAIGHSLGKNLRGEDGTVFCVLGDGELQEGQVWEAFMYASGKKVDNLIATIDYNQKQIDGSTDDVLPMGNLKSKLEAFDWLVLEEKKGNNIQAVIDILTKAKTLTGKGKPVAIILHTEMGNGVDFMMGTHKWHGSAPNDEQLDEALSQNPVTLGDY